jgi:hypothetical protein
MFVISPMHAICLAHWTCRSRVGSTPSYPGGLGLKSRPRPAILIDDYSGFSQPLQTPGQYLKLGHDRLPSHPFTDHSFIQRYLVWVI